MMVADCLAVLLGGGVATVLQWVFRPVPDFIVQDHLILLVCSLPLFIWGALASHLYRARANERSSNERRNILKAVGVMVGGLVVIAFVIQNDLLSRFWVIAFAISATVILMVEREITRRVFTRRRRQGKMHRPILIVGTDAHGVRLMHTFQRCPELGYTVRGFIGDDDIGERGGVSVLGPISDIERILAESDANGVVVSPSSVPDLDLNALTRRLTDLGYHFALSSNLRDIDMNRLRPQQFDGFAMLYVEPVIRHGWRRVAKRGFDVTMASVVLVLTLPVLLIAMAAIKLQDGGPLFFRQVRIGRGGRPFTVTKLRTMVVDAEDRRAELLERNEMDGPLFKMTNDPRVTRVGAVMRKLSIDELPQLVNVVRGSMSMVGPRPALPDEVREWDDQVHERLRVLPGITGMWQVSGRSNTTFEEYKRLDLYYVDNWSLSHDVRICVKTVAVVLRRDGAV
jgi:exopolysaccharide biosynthesis polyprenyl glycosylphosphotransferase